MKIGRREKAFILALVIIGAISYGGMEAVESEKQTNLVTWGECENDQDCYRIYGSDCYSCIGAEDTPYGGYCEWNEIKGPDCVVNRPTPTPDQPLKREVFGLPLWSVVAILGLVGVIYIWSRGGF